MFAILALVSVVSAYDYCDYYLQLFCSGYSKEYCQQCAKTKARQLSYYGCTSTDISQYCTTGYDCNYYLAEMGCKNSMSTPQSCLSCYKQNSWSLQQKGCNFQIADGYCYSGYYNQGTCFTKLNQVCKGQQGNGGFCTSCATDPRNTAALSQAGCDASAVRDWCTGMSPYSQYDCQYSLDQVCGYYAGQGTKCTQCIQRNQAYLSSADCSSSDFNLYCLSAPPPYGNTGCQITEKAYCPRSFYPTSYECLYCIQDNIVQLYNSGCGYYDVLSYCDYSAVEQLNDALKTMKNVTRLQEMVDKAMQDKTA